jgi:cobalamin biosynthesis Mg chelatase CobN
MADDVKQPPEEPEVGAEEQSEDSVAQVAPDVVKTPESPDQSLADETTHDEQTTDTNKDTPIADQEPGSDTEDAAPPEESLADTDSGQGDDVVEDEPDAPATTNSPDTVNEELPDLKPEDVVDAPETPVVEGIEVEQSNEVEGDTPAVDEGSDASSGVDNSTEGSDDKSGTPAAMPHPEQPTVSSKDTSKSGHPIAVVIIALLVTLALVGIGYAAFLAEQNSDEPAPSESAETSAQSETNSEPINQDDIQQLDDAIQELELLDQQVDDELTDDNLGI